MDNEVFSILSRLEDHHWWFVARRQIITRIVRALDAKQAAGLVVDVGCGTGGMVASLTPYVSCMGVDPTVTAIEKARSRFPELRFELADVAQCLEQMNDQIGIVMLLDVLEHIDDDRAFLSAVVDRLRPGTNILITVPARQILWSPQDERVGHRRRYEAASLRALWAGLAVTEPRISYFNSHLYPIVRMVRLFGSLTGISAGEAGTDFSLPPRFLNDLLRRWFSSETSRLVSYLVGGRGHPYRYGSSLVALARKT